MKRNLLLFAMLVLSQFSFAQVSFSDDFESYTVGSPLGPQSPQWTTWSGTQGGADDINVSNVLAHSGTKSLYFSSTLANGGPSDIVLPFSGPHTTGTFTFTQWMRVSTAKGAYFNFQGSNTVSTTFTLNTFFNTLGTLEISDSKGNVTLSNTYPQNAWFEFKFVANLNTNSWEVFIDGVSKGTFQNFDFSIASIDYYATNPTDAFWIDDVSFAYTPYTLLNLNGAVAYLQVDNGLTTQVRKPNVSIRNLGTTPINNFSIALNANGTITNQNFTGLNIASGATYVCALTSSVTLISGLNTITATISNVNGAANDDDAADNSKTITFTPVNPGEDKMVIGEEATGTWCQWCPRGAVALDYMEKYYDGFFQGIAVHNGDPMMDTIYDTGIGTLIGGYPSMLVDRGADIDPSGTTPVFLQRITMTPIAKLKNGASYNSTTGVLDVSLSTTFKSALTNAGAYKVACVIIEDSVKGTTSGYNQSNAYAGGNNGVMGGYETKSNPVPASQMTYMHVARDIAPSFAGMTTFPSSVAPNSTHISNFQFNISAWNKNRVKIVTMLIAPTGAVENGMTSTVDQAVSNGFVLGIKDKVIKSNFVNMYPNPTSDVVNLQINATAYGNANIIVRDIQGNTVMTNERKIVTGTNIIPISLSNHAKGTYMITVTLDKKIQTLPITLE